MAESPLIAPKKDATTIAQHVAKLSDRAIQRITGGNAFLRGRLYARRNAVADLTAAGTTASAKIMVRADQPYETQAGLTSEGQIISNCTCPAWRGPTGHCKHVAALLVALRDRERPPKPKLSPEEQAAQAKQQKQAKQNGNGQTGTVSVGGKRRRSRRRRRGGGNGEAQESGARQPGVPERSGLDAWLPSQTKRAPELEFRLAVRPASIAVSTVVAGTRQSVPFSEALGGVGAMGPGLRPLLRALARHATRGASASAEVRGEDAAEILSMLKGKRVLLEPASMELRFAGEMLKPRLELDLANGASVRVRVVFEQSTGNRRFPLSNGAWFEGTPGWHLDTTEGVARPVAENVTPAWLQRLYRSPALVHPISDLPHLLTEFLPKVASSLGASLPELDTVADVIDVQPHFALRAGGDLVDATAKVQVTYREHHFDVPPQELPPPLSFLEADDDEGRPRVVRREVGAEMAAVQEVMNLGFEVEEGALAAHGDTAMRFWTEGIGTLPEDWDRFIPDDLVDVTVRSTPVSPRMRISSGVDWLDLAMTFDAGGVAVSEDELRACLEQGRKLVRLEDGSYAPIEANQVGEVLERMAEILAGSQDGHKVPLSQAGRVKDLLQMVGERNVESTAQSLFGRLEDIGKVELLAKPRTLKANLRPYQKEGFSWLAFLHNLGSGGILADDMGLGKTVQAIALLLWAKGKEKRALNLVVAPTSVVPNWQREIEKFAPSFKAVVWQGPDRHSQASDLEDADVMITSYALLRRDEEFLQTLDFRYAILDEAQHIKNPMSATARAAKKLKSDRRLAMTGTPIENRLSEIWSIFDFVSPGLLGGLQRFEEKYTRPIERGDEEAAARLRATVHPFILRRTKSEVVKDLPEKIVQEIVVPMSEEQSKLYKQILRQVRDSVMSEVEKQGVQKASIQILAALTRLRQVACDPRLLGLEGVQGDMKEESGKLNALREIIAEAVAGGHRVLVFSQFVSMLQLVRDSLDNDDVPYLYLDGSTKDRQALVDRFNDDNAVPVFLISLKAGGTGLNLTGADTVIHYDPWWNPAVEDQATDRAHRIGQTNVVNVYRLIARNSVEEKILQLSEKKRGLVANVLTSEGAGLKGLTRADVDNLFAD